MYEKQHADEYRVENNADLEQAYGDWVENQYDSEPADTPVQFPEIDVPTVVTFTRDVAAGVDTVTVQED